MWLGSTGVQTKRGLDRVGGPPGAALPPAGHGEAPRGRPRERVVGPTQPLLPNQCTHLCPRWRRSLTVTWKKTHFLGRVPKSIWKCHQNFETSGWQNNFFFCHLLVIVFLWLIGYTRIYLGSVVPAQEQHRYQCKRWYSNRIKGQMIVFFFSKTFPA